MNKDAQPQQNEAMITLEGEDGLQYTCRILKIFKFNNREYILLLKMGDKSEEAKDKDEDSMIMRLLLRNLPHDRRRSERLVMMRLIERNGQPMIQEIASDEEFERVWKYVEEMARKG